MPTGTEPGDDRPADLPRAAVPGDGEVARLLAAGDLAGLRRLIPAHRPALEEVLRCRGRSPQAARAEVDDALAEAAARYGDGEVPPSGLRCSLLERLSPYVEGGETSPAEAAARRWWLGLDPAERDLAWNGMVEGRVAASAESDDLRRALGAAVRSADGRAATAPATEAVPEVEPEVEPEGEATRGRVDGDGPRAPVPEASALLAAAVLGAPGRRYRGDAARTAGPPSEGRRRARSLDRRRAGRIVELAGLVLVAVALVALVIALRG